ncbi:MAG: ubiquitin-like domain-containing protein [Candidatus Heimdallarchaeota archaeon]
MAFDEDPFKSDSEVNTISLRFKDPQLPPGQNTRSEIVRLDWTIRQLIAAVRDMFSIPLNLPIALLYKGRRLNPDTPLGQYNPSENDLMMIVPDQIKGGIHLHLS